MSNYVLQVLSRTPTWVWVLFVTLLVLGILQSKTRTMSGVRLFALPLAMLALSLYGLMVDFRSTSSGQPAVLLSWGAAKLLAVVAGRRLRQPAGASYSRDLERYLVPGSWVPLALMMTIFCLRYLTTASLAIDATLSHSLAFACATSMVYVLLSGTLLARALHVYGSRL